MMKEAIVIHYNGQDIALNAHGFLLDYQQWQPQIAELLAERDQFTLTSAHWEVIDFLRIYYTEYQLIPPMRLLVKAMAQKLGVEKASSRYLYQLFSESPIKQACRYAGLPKPVSCI